MPSYYLHFSDAAKFADVARNIFQGKGFGSDFAFFGGNVFGNLTQNLFPTSGILPVTPFSIAVFFKIFGINDFSVIATSFFYFLLTLIFVYLLSKKIFKTRLIAFCSAFVVGFSYDLINYATSGASESPFIFEIVSSIYFLSLRRRWATITGFVLMVVMYFTRTQAFIYIAALMLFYLLTRLKPNKAILYFVAIGVLGLLIDHFILPILPTKFLYSVTSIGSEIGGKYLPGSAVSDAMRGGASSANLLEIVKKIFYNLYNFYKLMPQVINPYFFALFMVGVFRMGKDMLVNSFKVVALFAFVVTFLVTAAGIPFFRYLHPIIPFIYIIAVGTLVEIINLLYATYNKLSLFNFRVSKNTAFSLLTLLFIILFGVGQTAGIFLLDSRFESNTHNVGKPPVYVILSQSLMKNTAPNQTVVTNLDTWGSWYGQRKTVWFPLEPKQLIDPSTGKIPFDAIYLTSYLIDDENYYMGEDWRLIFNNPSDSKKWTCDDCSQIAKEFKLKEIYKIDHSENYERSDIGAILLVKK